MGSVRVSDVEYVGGRVLRVAFTDGLVRELDFSEALPGVLALIDDDAVFPTVTVDAVAGTIAWAVGVDFDPDVLHGSERSASGIAPAVLREHHRERSR